MDSRMHAPSDLGTHTRAHALTPHTRIHTHASTRAHARTPHTRIHKHAQNTFVDERDEAELAGLPRRGFYHSCILDLPKLYMYIWFRGKGVGFGVSHVP
jgi:hypothetical protein